jgi:hypothetical protein
MLSSSSHALDTFSDASETIDIVAEGFLSACLELGIRAVFKHPRLWALLFGHGLLTVVWSLKFEKWNLFGNFSRRL